MLAICLKRMFHPGTDRSFVAAASSPILLRSIIKAAPQSSIHWTKFISLRAYEYASMQSTCLILNASKEEQRLSLSCLSTTSSHQSIVRLVSWSCSILCCYLSVSFLFCQRLFCNCCDQINNFWFNYLASSQQKRALSFPANLCCFQLRFVVS